MRLSAAHSSRPVARTRFRAAAGFSATSSRTNSPTARPSSAGRPSASPCQNGSLPGWPGAGRDQHPVVGDVLDPPRRRAQREDVADAGLVDHLLVELADPPSGSLARGQEHGVEPAVGDGAAAGDGQPLRTGPAGERAADPVPDEAGAQLGELVAGVAPGQHVEHRLEDRARQRGERRRPAHQRLELVDVPVVQGAHRDDLLGQHVDAGWPARAATRSTPSASGRRRRRSARGRRGTWGRPRRATPRPPGGRRGPRAAARWPRSAATRPGSPGRPRPCRCPARASWWPRPPAAAPP